VSAAPAVSQQAVRARRPALASAPGPASTPTLAARAVLAVIHAYQGIRAGRPSPCRFLPTCSDYALEAVESHGAARGGWLAMRRVLRCHPWGRHGLDPVPPSRELP